MARLPFHAPASRDLPPTAGVSILERCRSFCKRAGQGGSTQKVMQLQLFDPNQCKQFGTQYNGLLLKEILPGLEDSQRAERQAIGALSSALAIAGNDLDHPDFAYLCRSLQNGGYAINDKIALIPAYRFATDPKTAPKVAHLKDLRQIQGFRNSQLTLGGSAETPLPEPITPNRLAAPLNFDDLSQGGKLTSHVSGKIGEDSVEGVLKRLGIAYQPQFIAPFIGWGKSKQSRVDFKVAPFDASPLERGFYLEVKWRNRQLSADDNLTALLHNVEAWYDLPTLVLYDGEGAVRDAYETVKHQMDQKRRRLGEKLLSVMTFNEFVLWAQTQLGQQEVAA